MSVRPQSYVARQQAQIQDLENEFRTWIHGQGYEKKLQEMLKSPSIANTHNKYLQMLVKPPWFQHFQNLLEQYHTEETHRFDAEMKQHERGNPADDWEPFMREHSNEFPIARVAASPHTTGSKTKWRSKQMGPHGRF